MRRRILADCSTRDDNTRLAFHSKKIRARAKFGPIFRLAQLTAHIIFRLLADWPIVFLTM